MSTNTLGHSPKFARYWDGKGEKLADWVTVTSYEVDTVPISEEVEDYPYSGQGRIQGSFEYQKPTYDDSYAPKGSFEYRCGSGLFLISTDATRPSHEEVLSNINEKLSRDAEIKHAISVSREGLWQLFDHAESIDPLLVVGREGKYDLNDLLRVIRHSDGDALATLESLHREGKVENYHVLKRVLENIDDTKNVGSITDLDIDLHRCRVSYAVAEFRTSDVNFVTVTYSGGNIEIDADSESAREYAVKLVETHLIHEQGA